MRVRQPDKSLSLSELRIKIVDHKARGRKIISEIETLKRHFEKMLEYYEEWEDRLNKIQEAVNKASIENGISPGDVEEYDALADVFGE